MYDPWCDIDPKVMDGKYYLLDEIERMGIDIDDLIPYEDLELFQAILKDTSEEEIVSPKCGIGP